MGAILNASYRDMTQNAEAVFRIWRRFLRAAYSDAAFD